MGFFAEFRKGAKANALVSHLEFAKQRYFPNDLWYVTHHLGEAVKAMTKMRKAGAESIITPVGWAYIADLAAKLTDALEHDGHTELARDCRYIREYARQQLPHA